MNIPAYYEPDDPVLSVQDHVILLVDLAQSRGIDPHQLFKGSRLFYEDLALRDLRISPSSWLALFANLCHHLGAEAPFVIGQRLMPGMLGSLSYALGSAPHFAQALRLTHEFRHRLSPFLTPIIWHDDRYLWLLWFNAGGGRAQHAGLVELYSSAVAALSQHLGCPTHRWQFWFRHGKPSHIEQYWVHLGHEYRFDQPIDAMRLPLDLAFAPRPDLQPAVHDIHLRQARLQSLDHPPLSFLDLSYQLLSTHMGRPLLMEDLARLLHISPATLKRKYSRHGTGFQEQADLVRKHIALSHFLGGKRSIEEVASLLQFHDAANFRKSFRRWTGLSPRRFLDQLA